MGVKKCKAILGFILALLAISVSSFSRSYYATPKDSIIHIIFCSDLHFGLTKENFRGNKNVSAATVNAAMIEAMNQLPALSLPNDEGVGANASIRAIDALIITGDIANREENGVPAANSSWKEFEQDYLQQLQLHKNNGTATSIFVVAGNHDVSNAVGFHRPMAPEKDASSYVGIYNLMMHPATQKTVANFDYNTDKVHFATNIAGVHFQFVNLWPDSTERVWMEKDLLSVKSQMPVFVFTHSMPEVEARFFVNPNNTHTINEKDKFENLLSETFKDGNSVEDKAIIEQKAFAHFVELHPNIKAYFHGHSNYTEFYDWKGPENTIHLHCYRVDSPMKGRYSAKDETKLSFLVVSINSNTKKMTVRECLWNSHFTGNASAIAWGISSTTLF